ncbi:DUF2231 domain-containing protein [Saccharomonospora piscinae]|uniref:DUF2231 domain-containing protein n=1 Tax=Saccharomonospora piscinae TaxID=687388 RepID=UPI001106A1C0|nr:DUF2231 domain-containing protein [Saccharomonospora piscinae]TLW94508.1 DUF2231 domain-containing protein [Saccharomonospora piscinae]
MMLDRLLRKSESFDRLDHLTAKAATQLRRALDGRAVDRALRGSWLGHPVHPLAVTVPIGAWVSSAVFDALRKRDAARLCVAVGVVTVPTAVVTGLAEFSRLSPVQRRVGALHYLAIVAAQACYVTSHRCRTRGSHGAGAWWGLAGLAAVSAGGALGGHLSYALGAGVYEWQRGPES